MPERLWHSEYFRARVIELSQEQHDQGYRKYDEYRCNGEHREREYLPPHAVTFVPLVVTVDVFLEIGLWLSRNGGLLGLGFDDFAGG